MSLSAAAPARKKAVKKSLFRNQRHGDITLRFSAGPQLYQVSNASGEFLFSTIGERVFSLYFFPEYSYHFLENTSFFVSIPVAIDVDLLVQPTGGFGLSVGLRQYVPNLYKLLYFDLSMTISFMRRSLFQLEFGGFAASMGLSIPLADRVRLLVIGQVPINFIDGFVLSVRTYMGVETFF